MTNAIRRISMLLVIFMLATFCLASCAGLPSTGNDNNTDTPTDNTHQDQNKPEDNKDQTPPTPVIYSFELRTTKTNVVRGESVTLTAVLKSADSEETVEDVSKEDLAETEMIKAGSSERNIPIVAAGIAFILVLSGLFIVIKGKKSKNN